MSHKLAVIGVGNMAKAIIAGIQSADVDISEIILFDKNINFSKIFDERNLASLLATYGVAVSAGSACDAEHDDINGFNPSHVLKAIGLKERVIRNSVRLSFTKYTTCKDIDYFFEVIKSIKEGE